MSHRCGSLCAWRAGSMVPMRTAMLVRAVVHVPDWPSVRLGGTGRRSARLKCLRTTTRPGGHSPGNSYGCAVISAFPAASLVADPSTPSRRPGALVTSRQDLLITVRAVITTVRLCPGLVDGTMVRIRLSRWYFAFCKYLVTCDVRAWQLNSKVSAPYGH